MYDIIEEAIITMINFVKKCFTGLVFAAAALAVVPQAQAYSELDYLEGNWYDSEGRLFATVKDNMLNTYAMNLITIAGSPADFAAAVQVHEPYGYRNVPLEFSAVRADERAQNNPFFRPTVRMNGVAVHKEWFNVPAGVFDCLEGDWKTADGKVVAQFRGNRFNSYPITFLSFYGVSDHFGAAFKLDESGAEKLFRINLSQADGKPVLSIHRMNDPWGFDALTLAK